MAEAAGALAPLQGPEEAPVDAAAIRRCGADPLASPARSVRPPRGSGLVPQPLFAPLLFCSRARFSRVEQLSLKRRRRPWEEEEAEEALTDAEVALGLESAYQVGSSGWAGVEVRGFLLVYRCCGLIVVCFILCEFG